MAIRAKKTAIVRTLGEWNQLDSSVGIIIVKSSSFNDPSHTTMDMTRFVHLSRFVVGDESCMYVNELKLVGLSELDSVEIGENSFTRQKSGASNAYNGYFYLKNCPKLKSLKMGRFSFSDYTVIEIENVNALEVIEMGELNEESNNFYSASLQLSSVIVCVE